MTCIAPHAARRSASEDRQDEARAARAGNNACKVFHETRLLCFSRVTRHGSHGVRFDGGAQGARNQNPPPGPPRKPPGRRFSARCGAAWGGVGGILPLSQCPRSRRPAG